MQTENKTRTTLAAAATILGAATAAAADTPAVDQAAIDKAFEALKTYDWGPDRRTLVAIDAAVPATHGDAAARKALETRLAAVLSTEASRAAKDFVCRKLMIVGTAESVPALAAILPDEDLSHMARYALERIPAAEAAAALRDALPKLNGKLKVGVIGSLGVRRDAESISGPGRPDRRRRCQRCRGRRHGPGRHRHGGGRQGPARFASSRRRRRQAARGRRPPGDRRTPAGRRQQG